VTNAIWNPDCKPEKDLPTIYGFNNGGDGGFLHAVLIADDGTILGSHLCSHEGYMPGDLGVLEGHRLDRHARFREHYPNGYRMDFVPHGDVPTHEGLQAAFAKVQQTKKESP
jgi:hypothetical protein